MKDNLGTRLVKVDSFTAKAFTGNPAAVCVLDVPRSKVWMQSVAAEMNLSETAFVHRDADEKWNLRWFSPKVEVALCGHATMATVHALDDIEFTFKTKSGILRAHKVDGWIVLDFPAIRPVEVRSRPKDLLQSLGFGVEDNRVKAVWKGEFDYLVEVENESVVKELCPNFSDLGNVECRGVAVTTLGKDFDFVSRYFAPAVGIDEDPVCGSAHCMLAPYWADKLGRSQNLRAFQASKRGGELDLSLQGDRVLIKGQAVTVSEGKLFA